MSKIKKVWYYLKNNPAHIIDTIVQRFFCFLPDKLYLSLRFRCKMGYWINWKNPISFSEKLQWLKIYNRKPEYTSMVDKFSVKKYVEERIGKEYIIPTLGVWNSFEEIDWDSLPDRFVLKTTHGGGSGGVVICSDKSKFDKQAASVKLNNSLHSDIYKAYREWPYKNIKRRIIAETLLENKDGHEINDYKFFCFHGKVKFFKIDFNRFIDHHANYYSPLGTLLDFGEADLVPISTADVKIPDNLPTMIKLAEKLAANEPFIRIDLYNVNGKIYFGEITFYPASGMGRFTNEHIDQEIGSYIHMS